MKRCPNCKREIEENSTFCEYCGQQIKRSKKPLWIALSGVAAIAIVVLVIILASRSPKVESMHFSESKKYYAFIEELIKDAGNCDQLEDAADELESRIFDDSWDSDEMTQAENEKLQKNAKGLVDDIKKKAQKMGCKDFVIDESDLDDWCNPDKDEDITDTDWDSDW